jgi:hypothetical protein
MPIPKHLEWIVEQQGAIYRYEPDYNSISLDLAITFAKRYAKDCQHDILLVYNYHYLTVKEDADIAEVMQRYTDRDQPGRTRGQTIEGKIK